MRLGVAETLGLDAKTMVKVSESLMQFGDPSMHKVDLRKISEMVEVLIGRIYERFGYEVALAFVREQVVFPYLDAPFAGAPSTVAEILAIAQTVA